MLTQPTRPTQLNIDIHTIQARPKRPQQKMQHRPVPPVLAVPHVRGIYIHILYFRIEIHMNTTNTTNTIKNRYSYHSS